MLFHRYVALGDSFTEGVGDPDLSRPNGLRGWADRVAEVLADHAAAADADFGYANLAIRGRKMLGVLDEQVGPAIALEPDLVSINAGGNDLLRPRVDIDFLVDALEVAVTDLTATGARVIVFTHGDGGSSGVMGAIRGRVAIFNELLRGMADRAGAGVVLVDNWKLEGGRDPRNWDVDRLHLNPRGHLGVAINVLDTLGVAHDLVLEPLPDDPPKPRSVRRRENLQWTREHLTPWMTRRLTRRSSGDGVLPKRPTLGPL